MDDIIIADLDGRVIPKIPKTKKAVVIAVALAVVAAAGGFWFAYNANSGEVEITVVHLGSSTVDMFVYVDGKQVHYESVSSASGGFKIIYKETFPIWQDSNTITISVNTQGGLWKGTDSKKITVQKGQTHAVTLIPILP